MSISKEEKEQVQANFAKLPERLFKLQKSSLESKNLLVLTNGVYKLDLTSISYKDFVNLKETLNEYLTEDVKPFTQGDLDNVEKDIENLSQEQVYEILKELKEEELLPQGSPLDDVEVFNFAPQTFEAFRIKIHKIVFLNKVKRGTILLKFNEEKNETYKFDAYVYEKLFAKEEGLPNGEKDLPLRKPTAGRLYVTRKVFQEDEVPFCFSFSTPKHGTFVLDGSFGSAGFPAFPIPLNDEDAKIEGSLGLFQNIHIKHNGKTENLKHKSCYELQGWGSPRGSNISKPNPISIRIHFFSNFFSSASSSQSAHQRTLVCELQRIKNTAECRLIKFRPIANNKLVAEEIYGYGNECNRQATRKKSQKAFVKPVKKEETKDERKERLKAQKLRKLNIYALMQRYDEHKESITYSKEEEKIIRRELKKAEKHKRIREHAKTKQDQEPLKKRYDQHESESDQDDQNESESDQYQYIDGGSESESDEYV
jgi:hypothetical protein